MFEFFLSVRVSFWLVGAGSMPRRCAATLSVSLGGGSLGRSRVLEKTLFLK